MRRGGALGLVLAALLLGGCGGGGDAESAPTPATDPLVREAFGKAQEAVDVVRPRAESRALRPVVLFLHGWGAVDLRAYAPWVRHLARQGAVVLYPRYQRSIFEDPATVLANVHAGVRTALDRVEVDPRTLVVVGHSAGGALAADYAASARSEGLPVPRAIVSLYAGRGFKGIPLRIPEVGNDRIPDAVEVVSLGGADDATVGIAQARRIGRQGSFRLIRDRAVSDHLGPQRADAASRRTFWALLDRVRARYAAG